MNPLFRAIGFLETVHFLQAFHRLRDPRLYFDFIKRKPVRSQYNSLAQLYLDDFKAKNRQFARRQNAWFRKEPEYLWLDVTSEGKLHNVVNRVIDHLRKPSLAEDLSSDAQEKMRVANTEQALREYRSESRILGNFPALNQFIYKSLQTAKTHREILMNPLLMPENEAQSYHT